MADALLDRLSTLDTCVVSDALRPRARSPGCPDAAACFPGRRVAAGSGGVIVDGACRDVDEAQELGFPLYARAAVPRRRAAA